ncbi:MAG: AAA family ATPase [Clostridia bacterium]|nr:AAA family ATPase [Clostridia bacterium]
MFEKVVGQAFPKEILETKIKTGKLSHAYIFHGNKGVGKTTLAMEFMKAIVCETHSACGKCAACKQFYSTSDIKIVEGDKSISEDDVRQITSEIYLKPFHFSKKIYLIKDADKMTVQAQNALLKVFEEPPSYAILILVTSNVSLLLPTILSRGTKIRFSPLTLSELKLCFQNLGKSAPSDDILSRANGSVTEALSLLESDTYGEMRNSAGSRIVAFLKQKTTREMLAVFKEFLDHEEEFPKLSDLFYSIVYDCTINDPALKKNPRLETVSLPLATASRIYETLSRLSQRLSTNAGYSLSVLAALVEIRNHINERI